MIFFSLFFYVCSMLIFFSSKTFSLLIRLTMTMILVLSFVSFIHHCRMIFVSVFLFCLIEDECKTIGTNGCNTTISCGIFKIESTNRTNNNGLHRSRRRIQVRFFSKEKNKDEDFVRLDDSMRNSKQKLKLWFTKPNKF